MLRRFLCTALLLVLNQSFAAQLVLDGNELLGARNVEINSQLYDVEFVDGIGAELFGENGALFQDDLVAQPSAFAQALLSQVFIGIYDVEPGLTNGCSVHVVSCLTLMPYQVYGDDRRYRSIGVLNRNQASAFSDSLISSLSLWEHDDTSLLYDDINYAVWSLSEITPTVPDIVPTPEIGVSEPGTIAFILFGLACVATRYRPV